jgi:hypothetical protein
MSAWNHLGMEWTDNGDVTRDEPIYMELRRHPIRAMPDTATFLDVCEFDSAAEATRGLVA